MSHSAHLIQAGSVLRCEAFNVPSDSPILTAAASDLISWSLNLLSVFEPDGVFDRIGGGGACHTLIDERN